MWENGGVRGGSACSQRECCLPAPLLAPSPCQGGWGKADRSLDKLQVSEGWVLQGWPRPQAHTCPHPGTLPRQPQHSGSLGNLGSISKSGWLTSSFTVSENLPEAKSFFFHLVRPAPASQCLGTKKLYLRVCHFRRRREDQEETRTGLVARFSLPPPAAGDSANPPRRRGRPCWGKAERWYLWPNPSCCWELGRATHIPTGLLHVGFPPISVGQSPQSD